MLLHVTAMAQNLKVPRILVRLISIFVMDAESGFRAVVRTPLATTRFGNKSCRPPV
jgi:hypothetical protein